MALFALCLPPALLIAYRAEQIDRHSGRHGGCVLKKKKKEKGRKKAGSGEQNTPALHLLPPPPRGATLQGLSWRHPPSPSHRRQKNLSVISDNNEVVSDNQWSGLQWSVAWWWWREYLNQ